jgi:hypothetical protein
MYNHLIVLTAPLEGRDNEFNDWYTWVHIRDVMRLSPVMIATQRFHRSAQQVPGGPSGRYSQPYLAIYENTNPERLTADHKPQLTPEMPISNAIDTQRISEAYYDTLACRNKAPGQFPTTDVIAERVEAGADAAAFADWYIETRFPALMRLPGMVSGFVGRESSHQMLYELPRPRFTCVYHTTDLAASLNAWRKCEPPTTFKFGEYSVDCYTPLIERVTAVQVREADPVSTDTAKRKRAALGDKVMTQPASFIREGTLEKTS